MGNMDIKSKLIDTLTTIEKINYVLEQQEKGIPQRKIAEWMGYSETNALTKFMKKQGYTKVNDIFIKGSGVVEDKERTNNIKTITNEIIEDNKPTIVLQNQDMQNKLFDMLNNYDSFIEMVKWFNNSERGYIEDKEPTGNTIPIKQDTTIIEVNTGLQINYNKTKTKKTTIRLDEAIWEEFDNFCTDKYSQFSKQDLLSQALREFMDKYMDKYK